MGNKTVYPFRVRGGDRIPHKGGVDEGATARSTGRVKQQTRDAEPPGD